MLAPRRKDEFISASSARTQTEPKDLKTFSVDKLVIKPKKMQVLPANWKKGDLESLRELYARVIVPTSLRRTTIGAA